MRAAVLAAWRMNSTARPTVPGNCCPPCSNSLVMPNQPPSFEAAQTLCMDSGTSVFLVSGSYFTPALSMDE